MPANDEKSRQKYFENREKNRQNSNDKNSEYYPDEDNISSKLVSDNYFTPFGD